MISKSTLDVGSGTTPADFVYSGDTLVWKRYYDTGLWVHPLNTVNVTFTDFQAQSISGDGVTINWGDGEINLANDSTDNNPNPITHTIDANAGTKAIEIVSPKDDVTLINFGNSGNGTLGGTIDITEYPNIVEFICENHGVENFVDSSPTEKTSLAGLNLSHNALTSFPDTSSYTSLARLYIHNNTAAMVVPDSDKYMTISGAGLAEVNGSYIRPEGILLTLQYELKDDVGNVLYEIQRGSFYEYWRIVRKSDSEIIYEIDTSNSSPTQDTVPLTGWQTVLAGAEPAPTVSFTPLAIPSNLPNNIVQLLIYNSGLSGEIPHGNLPSSPGVAQFAVRSNSLMTGSVLNSDFTQNLNGCTIYNCNFTGSVPSLRWGSATQRLVSFNAQNNAFTSIANPFVVYASAAPNAGDVSLKTFNISANNIPKADILRALQAFYVAFVVANKPAIPLDPITGKGGDIRMDTQTPNAGILNSDTLPDYPAVTVGDAKTALLAKGFTSILL